MSSRALYGVALAVAIAGTSCARDTNAPTADSATNAGFAVVSSVMPASGATNVDPSAPIVISFNRQMMVGVDLAVVLHEGTISGPVVLGTATWSADHKQLTFTPNQRLKFKTTYLLHLSPNLVDATGQPINFGYCAGWIGGQPVSAMGWGMMGWGTGPVWRSGTGPWGYGMWLTFTTA